MRELRVISTDGSHLICAERQSGRHFRIPVEKVRELLGEPAVFEAPPAPAPEPPPPPVALTPREIQARIRAGATVDELAELTGASAEKVNRFAHPVLLERLRASELARASHPLVAGGPSLSTLGELVAECLVLRGSALAEARWDAWKAEEGQWVVQVAWTTGSTDFYAHWRFYPGAHGGTTDPIDEFALELTDPERARAARRRAPKTLTVAPEPQPRREVTPDGHEQVTVDADSLIDAQRGRRGPRPVSRPVTPPPAVPDVPAVPEIPAPRISGDAESGDTPALDGMPAPAAPTPHRPSHAKRGKPAVPAWEDVLLGVRSHPHS